MFYDVDFEKDLQSLKFKALRQHLNSIKENSSLYSSQKDKDLKLFMPKKRSFNWIKDVLGDEKEQVYH